jgi:asparagine synthase (glutamine-hydrolysing)
MTDTLVHRGPDDRNVYVNGSVGLGHTRLSIIDLAGSVQPMHSVDGRFTLVFNGEIFNYRELRSSLSYPWATQGDTEVLLASVAQGGPKTAERFVGQFAFGMYDHATGDTLLMRDRVGILPLYYYVDATLLAFASEVKALLVAIPGGAQLDHAQLPGYLSARAVPAPDTLFLGVKKVRPGHVLRVSAKGAVTSEPYWTLPDPSDRLELSDQAAIDLVDEALVAAVDSSLVADVPVGSYLSGGVDSSLIVALAASARVRLGSAEPVKTFSADFGDPRVDETEHADFVSEVFGTDHRRVRVEPSDFIDRWSELTWYRDAPVSEPADIAVARLAQVAREHVKVVLSGEGSDELFGGYPKYRFANVTKWAGLVPAELRRVTLRPIEQALPAGRARLRIAVRAMTAESAADRMSTWFAPFTSYECAALLGTAATSGRPAIPHRGGVDLMGRVDLAGWLPDNLLERGDRMSMAASLELRPPFLDHRMVDLAFKLPGSLKVRSGTTKWVLKQVALRYLPQRIVIRPKIGFRVPLDAWFRDGLRDLSYDMLTARDSFVGGILDQYHIRRILASHASGRRDEENRIWTLMSLETWGRQFITGHSERPSVGFTLPGGPNEPQSNVHEPPKTKRGN